MQSNTYQLLSLGARVLFLLLALLIVLHAGLNLLQQHIARKRLLKKLPDAGMVGEMRDMDSGKSYPLAREGVLGGSRGCDIRLKGLRRRQVNFVYVDGKGILLTPCHRRSNTLLDGEMLRRGAYALHGAILRVGGYTLRIRLFSGLNVPQPAQFQHSQPVYEDELYAPDVTLAGHGFYVNPPMGQQPEDWYPWEEDGQSEPAPAFSYAPAEETDLPPQAAWPPADAPYAPGWEETQAFPAEVPPEIPRATPETEAPQPFAESAAAPEDAPIVPPQRHRRADRRRER